MIKVTYKLTDEKMKKPEITQVNIYDGRIFIRYNVPNKADSVVRKMKEDGRKDVMFSRGVLIQRFPNKNEKEILEIVKKDIENGLYVAEEKTKRKLKISDLKIEE